MRIDQSLAELRTCSLCRDQKPRAEFHRHGAGYQRWCKACRRTYDAKRYPSVRSVRLAQRQVRGRQLVARMRDMKTAQPCIDCGGRFHPAAMGFDHLPGTTKRNDVSALANRGCTKLFEAEIAKCDVICANCHAIRTFLRREERPAALSAATQRDAGARRPAPEVSEST